MFSSDYSFNVGSRENSVGRGEKYYEQCSVLLFFAHNICGSGFSHVFVDPPQSECEEHEF